MNRQARLTENICKIYLAKYMYGKCTKNAYKSIIKRHKKTLKTGTKNWTDTYNHDMDAQLTTWKNIFSHHGNEN